MKIFKFGSIVVRTCPYFFKKITGFLTFKESCVLFRVKPNNHYINI